MGHLFGDCTTEKKKEGESVVGATSHFSGFPSLLFRWRQLFPCFGGVFVDPDGRSTDWVALDDLFGLLSPAFTTFLVSPVFCKPSGQAFALLVATGGGVRAPTALVFLDEPCTCARRGPRSEPFLCLSLDSVVQPLVFDFCGSGGHYCIVWCVKGGKKKIKRRVFFFVG